MVHSRDSKLKSQFIDAAENNWLWLFEGNIIQHTWNHNFTEFVTEGYIVNWPDPEFKWVQAPTWERRQHDITLPKCKTLTTLGRENLQMTYLKLRKECWMYEGEYLLADGHNATTSHVLASMVASSFNDNFSKQVPYCKQFTAIGRTAHRWLHTTMCCRRWWPPRILNPNPRVEISQSFHLPYPAKLQ